MPAPDLPGCIATGKTLEQTRARMQVAIDAHLRAMREDGDQIPEPSHVADMLDVAYAATVSGFAFYNRFSAPSIVCCQCRDRDRYPHGGGSLLLVFLPRAPGYVGIR